MKQLQRVLMLALAVMLVGAPALAQTQPQTQPGNLQPKTSPDPTTISPPISPRQPSTSPTVNPFPSPVQPSASPSTPGSSFTSGDRRLNTSGQAAPAAPASKEDCKDGWQKHGFKDEVECIGSLTSGKDRR